MQSAPLLLPRRRRLLPVALVVLLHWIVLSVLLDVKLELPRQNHGEGGAATILAQVLPATVPPPPPPPAPLPVPEAAPLPLPVIPPIEFGMPAQAGGFTVGMEPGAADGMPGGSGVEPAPASTAPAPAPPPAPPAPEAPAPAEPAAPAAPEMRRYKVDMPPPASITLDVARTDKDGTEWSGEALLAWQLNDDTYKIQVEAGIRVVFTRVNLVVLHSEGAVAATGFAPIKMTEKRRGRSLTATHFNWGENKLTFSASQAAYPLVAGAQDKASVPLQLAAIARGDAKQLSGDIDIFVGEDRDASVYRFKVVGQEEIDTRLGKLQTWHLTRPPLPGSYKSTLDIWLAPQHGWYPVRIRNSEANGAVTTQTVNNIVLNHSGF
ncbi:MULTISPECIES: DUF3108 domain-containing protein [Massilia]|uniref:Uncharacterized protein n=1 Tax=Massilia aurea TaxID=373040 RepID=A0A422QF24_9BURK|nr:MULTISPECIES: DUF3108 domain-containing protein [Massilia]MDY0964654.1 DUF3108 domain-containing protein [Massilia sp. CFBP9026]RNF28588.1 hypothetical protein NM04_22420 [Massilia aurea]